MIVFAFVRNVLGVCAAVRRQIGRLTAIRTTNSWRYLSKREQLARQTERINSGGPFGIRVLYALVALTPEEMHLTVSSPV